MPAVWQAEPALNAPLAGAQDAETEREAIMAQEMTTTRTKTLPEVLAPTPMQPPAHASGLIDQAFALPVDGAVSKVFGRIASGLRSGARNLIGLVKSGGLDADAQRTLVANAAFYNGLAGIADTSKQLSAPPKAIAPKKS